MGYSTEKKDEEEAAPDDAIVATCNRTYDWDSGAVVSFDVVEGRRKRVYNIQLWCVVPLVITRV